MLKSCPGSVDISDLQFKLQCRLKTFENEDFSAFSKANSLLSCASRYGLLFVGSTSNHFQVIQTQTLHSYGPKDKNVADYPRRNIEIPSLPKHLCVNCDSTLLAVVVEKDQCPIVIFYEVLSFLRQNINVIKEIRLSSTPNVYIREINWNPSLPAIFTACKSDGSLGVYELKGESVDINELPAAASATCFCWSPKGKQIAVGSKDGKITQYKPDLKAVKAIGEPKLEGPHTIINLQWVSNYQFIGVYQSVQSSASYIIVVDAPKTGEPSYTNYDDICYSGSSRPAQFYLILQQTWNFLMIGSANSAEVGVLGSNGESWIQWIMSDTGRAELPLSLDHQETLPVGLTFDISSTTPLPWGESSIPPCPILCVLSHQGVLCCFNVVYLKEGIPSVCTPPDPVSDTSGLSTFITSSASKKNVTEIAQPKPQQVPSSEIKFGVTDTQLQTNSTPAKDGLFSFPSASTALNIQHQSTPLVTAKSSADSLPKTLFGGQATLTPIKHQQPSQGMPLYGGQTLITPISKGSNGTVPSTNSATNFTEKYGSIFSSVQPTSAPQSSAVPVKPIVISASSVKPEASKLPEAAAKPQVIAPKTHVSTPKEAQRSIAKPEPQIDNKAETSAMLSQMIRDEWMYLETELKLLLNMGRGVKVNVGIDKEKVDMVEQIASLQEFVKEAVDISVGQSSEIHFLKQNLIQSWAWFEEAKSHYNSSKNEAVTLLIKLQPLDSLSQKRLRDIEHLIYYVESQLSQASKALDEQWDNFQDYAKKIHKVKMPTMEAIFQTMVSQNAILQKHTYTLKDISMRLRRKTSNMNSLLLSLDKGRDLADDFQELRLNPQNLLQLQYEKIKNHAKNLSETKAKKLRNLLNQREVTRVTAIKPQLSSWAINQSPASRMRQSISKLGSSMSPVARNLDFIQSPSVKALEVTQPVQLTQFSMKTPEKHTLATTPNAASAPTSFFPLVKSGPVISSSQGSAFTPIGGAATSIASDKQQQLFKSSASPMSSFSFGVTPNKSVAKITSSSFSEALTSSTAVVTTASSKISFSVAGGIFKSASETATVKPQPTPTTSTFAFGSGGAVPKSIFGTPTSNLSFVSSSSNNSFPIPTASSSSAFGSLTNLNKPNVLANAVSSSQNVKKTVIATAATDSAASTPKPTSGVASIFANIQSVIDKATGSTTADSSKPAISFSTTTSAVTTTTQSVFGSFAATRTAGSFFGSIAKPAADSATSPGIFGVAPKSSSTSIFGQPTKVVEASCSASNVTASESIKTTESKPETTNVITVSLFGSKPTTAASTVTSTTTSIFAPQSNTSIFGASTAPSPTAQGDITPSAPSIFITPKTTAPISSSTVTTTTSTSIFGSPSQSSTIFGSSPTSTTAPNIFATNTTATTGSVFGTSATPASGDGVFGPPTTSIFGSPAQSKSIFGSSTTTTPAFGSTATSDFVTPAASTATNAFGTPAASTAISAFGTPAASSATSTFGTPTASTATSPFGTPAAPANIFGSPTPSNAFEAPTTKPSLFGSPATGSIFGATPPGTSANIFASPTTVAFGTAATTTSTSIFGSPTTTTSSSLFGSSTTGSVQPFGSQSGSIFGGTNTSGNTFGQPAAFGSQTTPFGGAQPTTASSIFGQPSAFGAASQSSSVFGSGTTAASTSGNIFGSAAAASSSGFGSGFGTTPTTNAFGSPAATQSSTGSFGFGGLSVGATSSSESIFGGNSGGAFNQTPNANPFGKVEAKPAFGSSSSNIFGNTATTPATTNAFGSPASTASSIFGSSTSGAAFGSSTAGGAFGSPSAFGGTSTFGQKPAFGQPAAFGATAFGSPQAGAFSGGAASPVAQSGFGSASFQKPGFGSAPIFGGSPAPAFGASPSFGGTASFGSAPAFGSPEKVFGSTQPASGFPASASQNAGFGNIASQNTIGFGNLAQQANTSTSMPFSGNSSFSSWR